MINMVEFFYDKKNKSLCASIIDCAVVMVLFQGEMGWFDTFCL